MSVVFGMLTGSSGSFSVTVVWKVFDAGVHVTYAMAFVESREYWPAGDGEARAGQVNGLCGAAVPGRLKLTTGLHTGWVGLMVEVYDTRPAVDEAWEDVVEVSFTPATRRVRVAQWEGGEPCAFDLDPVTHRVRYSATGMDAAHQAGVVFEDEPPVDRYLLQLWPEPHAPDAVVKQTSAQAAYWHRHARTLPPPPTPEEKAEAERLAREREAHARAERVRAYELRMWDGIPPTDRLRHAGGNVHGIRMLDVHLTHAIARTGAQTQRAIARHAAHRAFAEARLTDIDWIAPALTALDEGRALPPPFDDPTAVWQRLWDDDRVPHTMITLPDNPAQELLQQAAALPALFAAAEPDPLQAALDAVFAAAVTFGADHRAFLDDVRRTHPEVAAAPPPPAVVPPPPFPWA